MENVGRNAIVVAGALLLSACATPTIDTARFSAPKTVVIDDFPDMKHVATIDVVVTNWPAMYFSPQFDGLFKVGGSDSGQSSVADNSEQVNTIITNQIINSPRPVSIGTGAAMGAVGGLVGALIQGSAEETQKRAAEFPALLKKTLPNVDMRVDVIKALRQALEAKGVTVRVASETRNAPMRLRWPAKNDKGEPIVPGALAGSPPVDADLVVQIAPVAIYAAPGPLNSYSRRVGIAVAMFDGRTRQFLGWQAFPFKPADGKFEYVKYDSLVSDLPNAAPALHGALLSLIPQVVDVIAGKRM